MDSLAIIRFAMLVGAYSTNPYRWSQTVPAAAELISLRAAQVSSTGIPAEAVTLAQRMMGKGWTVLERQILDMTSGKPLHTDWMLFKSSAYQFVIPLVREHGEIER